MIYDPLTSPSVSFVPLGTELGYYDPPVPDPADPNKYYLGGQVIYPYFVPKFHEMGGESVVGLPNTAAYHNDEKRRTEQHFEYFGFYILDDDPLQKVHLLEYGLLSCNSCPQNKGGAGTINRSPVSLPENFVYALRRIGTSFPGQPLQEAFINEAGLIQVAFENVVLVASPDNPDRVYPLAITEQLGFERTPLVEDRKLFDPASESKFFEIKNGLGHNIPNVFFEQISRHGGFDFTGFPITEIFKVEDGLFRQCFENMCIDYYVNRDENVRVSPTPLGAVYLSTFDHPVSPAILPPLTLTETEFKLYTAELNPLISSNEEQIVFVFAMQDKVPLENVRLVLKLTGPDGNIQYYAFPPTAENGQSLLRLPPIQAPNSTLILYEVCLENTPNGPVCTSENYMIWGNP